MTGFFATYLSPFYQLFMVEMLEMAGAAFRNGIFGIFVFQRNLNIVVRYALLFVTALLFFPCFCKAGYQMIQSECNGDSDNDRVVIFNYYESTNEYGNIVKYFDMQNYFAVVGSIFETADYNPKLACIVAYAGDFDGDAIDELVVTHDQTIRGTPYGDNIPPGLQAEEYVGKVYILKRDTTDPNATVFVKWRDLKPGFLEYGLINGVWKVTKIIPSDVAIGDFDGDGKDEIALSTLGSIYYSSKTQVYDFDDNDNPVMIQEIGTVYPAFPGGLTCAGADFNGDGNDELACAPYGGDDDIRVFQWNQQDNNGFKTAPENYFARLFDDYKNYDRGVTVSGGDFDGDGAEELILSSMYNNDDVRTYKFNKDLVQFEHTSDIFDFYPANEYGFQYGVQARAYDFSGDGTDEIILSPYRWDHPINKRMFFYSDGHFDINNVVLAGLSDLYVHVAGGSFDGTRPTRPAIEITDSKEFYPEFIHPYFAGEVTDALHFISKIEYQFTAENADPVDGDWKQISICQQNPDPSKKMKFAISAPVFPSGRYRLHIRAQNDYDRYSKPRSVAFQIIPWSAPTSAQPFSVAYSDSDLSVYTGSPYNDNDPESSLNLFRKVDGQWDSYPILSIDMSNNFVNTKVDRYDIEYAAMYVSPACSLIVP